LLIQLLIGLSPAVLDKLDKKCCGYDFWSEGFFFADRRRFVAKGFGYAV